MTRGLDRATEARRLRDGSCSDEPPVGMGRFELEASAPSNARRVLERARSVMSAVLRSMDGVAGRVEPATFLPRWFLEASGPEQSLERAKAWLEQWRKLSPADREAAEAARRWSVSDFLYWFEPEQREWWWWGAESLGDDRVRICLVSHEVSFPHQALEWLLRAAGAASVLDEDVSRLSRR